MILLSGTTNPLGHEKFAIIRNVTQVFVRKCRKFDIWKRHLAVCESLCAAFETRFRFSEFVANVGEMLQAAFVYRVTCSLEFSGGSH
jgi:hypothetical protein